MKIFFKNMFVGLWNLIISYCNKILTILEEYKFLKGKKMTQLDLLPPWLRGDIEPDIDDQKPEDVHICDLINLYEVELWNVQQNHLRDASRKKDSSVFDNTYQENCDCLTERIKALKEVILNNQLETLCKKD